jgi:hypothetical protein
VGRGIQPENLKVQGVKERVSGASRHGADGRGRFREAQGGHFHHVVESLVAQAGSQGGKAGAPSADPAPSGHTSFADGSRNDKLEEDFGGWTETVVQGQGGRPESDVVGDGRRTVLLYLVVFLTLEFLVGGPPSGGGARGGGGEEPCKSVMYCKPEAKAIDPSNFFFFKEKRVLRETVQ